MLQWSVIILVSKTFPRFQIIFFRQIFSSEIPILLYHSLYQIVLSLILANSVGKKWYLIIWNYISLIEQSFIYLLTICFLWIIWQVYYFLSPTISQYKTWLPFPLLAVTWGCIKYNLVPSFSFYSWPSPTSLHPPPLPVLKGSWVSHIKGTAGGKLSEFPREASQNIPNGSDVNWRQKEWRGNGLATLMLNLSMPKHWGVIEDSLFSRYL